MTDPAQAFLNHGNVDQWTRGAGPITGIGTTMGHGSWPIYTAPEKPTSWRVFWRNPDTNGGDLWSQPGKMFESPGILEPGQRARLAARGVRNVDDGWNLLRDIFLFATLECVAAARYPAP